MASFACAMSSSPPAKMVVSSPHIATTVCVVSCCTWMRSMCMPLMVCLSMRDNGSMASAKRRGASGHPCPTPRSLLNGSDTDCDPMTRSVKPLCFHFLFLHFSSFFISSFSGEQSPEFDFIFPALLFGDFMACCQFVNKQKSTKALMLREKPQLTLTD